jgi:hypothetical protein
MEISSDLNHAVLKNVLSAVENDVNLTIESINKIFIFLKISIGTPKKTETI